MKKPKKILFINNNSMSNYDPGEGEAQPFEDPYTTESQRPVNWNVPNLDSSERMGKLDLVWQSIQARMFNNLDAAYEVQEEIWGIFFRDFQDFLESDEYEVDSETNSIILELDGERIMFPIALAQDTHLATFKKDPNQVTGRESISVGQIRTAMHVIKATKMKDGDIVVDAGSGLGALARIMASFKNITVDAVNISKKQHEKGSKLTEFADEQGFLKGRINHIKQNILKYKRKEKADIFVFFESLLHMDRKKAFEKAYEILKPGGRIVFTEVSFALGKEELQKKIEGPFNSKFMQPEDTMDILEHLEFENIRIIEDFTPQIKPLIRIILKRIDEGYYNDPLISKFGEEFALKILEAWREFAEAFDNWGYYLMSAEKPLLQES